jgi:REP element-mobilizing transposase RayT
MAPAMAQSLARVVVHVVFATKRRRPLLDRRVRGPAHAYLARVVNKVGCRSIRVGGTEDHVHMLLSLARTCSLAEVVEAVKGSSSRWMTHQGVGRFA